MGDDTELRHFQSSLAADDGEATAASTTHGGDDDDDSDILSDLDEGLYANYSEVGFVSRNNEVVPIDEDTVNLIGVHKKKRSADAAPKRKQKRRRDLKHKQAHSDDDGGGIRSPSPVIELTAEEQRRLELDRKMDEALKNPRARKKKKANDHDLEMMDDKTVEDLVRRMIDAAQIDADAVEAGNPAAQKISMLPEVSATMARTNLLNIALDCQILAAIRQWLEPLPNRTLPAYNVQKLMFDILSKLKPDISFLRESGIGKIVMFYTKDRRPQSHIKRQAEILVRDWSRPVLGRSDDYHSRELPVARYEGQSRSVRRNYDDDDANPLAPPRKDSNRAKPMVEGSRGYDVAPQSRLVTGYNAFAKPIGNQGDDLVRRLKAKKSKSKGAKSGMIIG